MDLGLSGCEGGRKFKTNKATPDDHHMGTWPNVFGQGLSIPQRSQIAQVDLRPVSRIDMSCARASGQQETVVAQHLAGLEL